MLKLTTDEAELLSAPDTKAGKYQCACLEWLRQHEREGTIPTNGRFLFYELEQQGVAPKAYYDASGKKRARTPAQDLSDATMRLRELGLVPWEWILDETCSVKAWRYAASAYEYVANSAPRARIDCWDGELPPLILCESRATAGVLERIASDYLCPITATGGQSGGHIVTEIVPLLRGNDCKVFYIGDCEVGGPADQIEAATRRRIEEHTGRKFTDDTWIRVALTPEQVARSPRLRKLAIDKLDQPLSATTPVQSDRVRGGRTGCAGADAAQGARRAAARAIGRRTTTRGAPAPRHDCRARQDGAKTAEAAMIDTLVFGALVSSPPSPSPPRLLQSIPVRSSSWTEAWHECLSPR
jgi:hypothetical protein